MHRILQTDAKGGDVSDAALLNKAKTLARSHFNLSQEVFQASDGWLQKFKKRHNIKSRTRHGESG